MDCDILPWVERFRPKILSNILSQKHVIKIINEERFSHILLYGPPGCGKTSVIEAYIKQKYGSDSNIMVLNINTSEERGIDVVRDKINGFINSDGFIHEITRMVILDEVDAMTIDAQIVLSNVLEQSTSIKFCLICNYIKKIIPSIQSRCVLLKFSPLCKKHVKTKINEIAKIISFAITPPAIDLIYRISKGDMRKVINILQSTYMSAGNNIDINDVAKCNGYPLPEEIETILKWITKLSVKKCNNKLSELITEKGYSLANIITELTELVTTKFLNKEILSTQYSHIIMNMKPLELNLTVCPSEHIQQSGLISIN